MNNKTAEEIIQKLQLVPHPEGGFYRETYRSSKTLGDYHLGTAIYFLLTAENHSNFHRIKQDELWFHHYGSDIDIHCLAEGEHRIDQLGINSSDALPYRLIPKNTIFGSSLSEGSKGFALVSCVVIPGFEFRDFELFSRAQLLKEFPDSADIIKKLTPETD